MHFSRGTKWVCTEGCVSFVQFCQFFLRPCLPGPIHILVRQLQRSFFQLILHSASQFIRSFEMKKRRGLMAPIPAVMFIFWQILLSGYILFYIEKLDYAFAKLVEIHFYCIWRTFSAWNVHVLIWVISSTQHSTKIGCPWQSVPDQCVPDSLFFNFLSPVYSTPWTMCPDPDKRPRETRARICKPFKEPRNRFPAWRSGTTTLFDVLAH